MNTSAKFRGHMPIGIEIIYFQQQIIKENKKTQKDYKLAF